MKEKVFDLIIHLKKQGYEQRVIDKRLNETFSMNEEEIETIRIQLQKSGKQNLTIGYSVLAIAVLLFILSMSVGGSITIGGIIIFVFGIFKISKGYEQLRE